MRPNGQKAVLALSLLVTSEIINCSRSRALTLRPELLEPDIGLTIYSSKRLVVVHDGASRSAPQPGAILRSFFRQRAEIIAVCNAAYGEDLESLFLTFGSASHLLGTEGGKLVSHAMWVTRWLKPKGLSLLETAYVEMVATSPEHQGRGLATQLMQRLVDEVDGFEFAALCPADTSLYTRLGWEEWRGNLYIRRGDALQRTPDERVLIWRLPRTPADLDTDEDLSAEWRLGELW